MFRAARMMHLSLLILERHERLVLRELGELGLVQLARTPAGPDTAPWAAPDRSGDRARCEQLLARVQALRQNLEMLSAECPGEIVEISLQQADERLKPIEKRVADLLKRRQELSKQCGELTGRCEQLASYRGLDLPLDRFSQPSFLHFLVGSLPGENVEQLQAQIGENVALLPLAQQNGRTLLVAITTRRGRGPLEKVLEGAGFRDERLPVNGASADAVWEESNQHREQATAQLNHLKAELQALAREVTNPAAVIERSAMVEKSLLEAGQNFPRTSAAVLLTGWVPAVNLARLQQRLREITAGRCVLEIGSPANLSEEEIPVLLENRRLLRPFEMLVRAYGLPKYEELEPTLFVAISYVVMFGMMFGDVGHGAVLGLAGLAALRLGRTPKERDMGVLLLFGALSSAVFGLIYGSFFGIPALKKFALGQDPLEGNPISWMYGAIGLGFVLISLGLILNIIDRFRRGDLLGALLGKFGVSGVLFYWGAVAFITKFAELKAHGLVTLAIALFLVLPIVGWTLKEPLEFLVAPRVAQPHQANGGLFGALTESLVGAFEAVLNYLANTISFVRLAAYAMSHAALLMAAFMMAAEVKRFSPGGDVLSVVVIVIGNLVAIVLEGIIASVQALRLEYYEFFGKFFSGNGQPFKPFRLTSSAGYAAGKQIGMAAVPTG